MRCGGNSFGWQMFVFNGIAFNSIMTINVETFINFNTISVIFLSMDVSYYHSQQLRTFVKSIGELVLCYSNMNLRFYLSVNFLTAKAFKLSY